MAGDSLRRARTVSAKMCAPPSGRSSRATLVTTTCSRFILATASATRRGSPPPFPAGRPGVVAPKLPALAEIGAVGLLAHGVEGGVAQQPLEVVVVLAARQPGLDPLRVPAQRRAARRCRGVRGPAP